MFDLLLRCKAQIKRGTSAGAATRFEFTSPAGETWIVQELIAFHDDPAGATLSWVVQQVPGTTITIPIGVIAINVQVRLGAYYNLPALLPPGWEIKIEAAGPLAAGKIFTMEAQIHSVIGVPAGVWT